MVKTATKSAHAHVLMHVRRAIAGVDAALSRRVIYAARRLASVRGKIITLGVGKSGFVAAKVAATLTSMGVPSAFLHAADAMHGDLGIVASRDAVVAFSNSGNTKEILATLAHIHKHGIPIVAVTGSKSSRLTALSGTPLVYRVSNEGSPHNLAPMASTTVAMVIGDMLAAQVATLKGFTKQKFANLHPSGSLGLHLTRVGSVMVTGRKLPVIRSSASFHYAVKQISMKHLGIVAVTDNRGRLVGALTDGDVRRFVLTGRSIEMAKVTDAMKPRPKTITAQASLLEALASMEERKITSLFITDSSGRLEGLVHMHQIVERHLI